MTILEAIDHRMSIRRYTDTPIESAKIKTMKKCIAKCNKESELHMEWIDDASSAFSKFIYSYGMFSGVRSLIVIKGKKDIENLQEKFGRYGELVLLEAVRLDLGTCWVAGTFDRKNPIFGVQDDELLAAVITVGYQAPVVKTKLGSLIKRKRAVEKLYVSDTKPAGWFIKGMKAVRMAPSALNRQPVKFFYINGVVLASIKDVGNPPYIDLGIAKIHFELAADGRFEYGNGGLFTKNEKKKELVGNQD